MAGALRKQPPARHRKEVFPMQDKAIWLRGSGCEPNDALRADIRTQHVVLGVVVDERSCVFTVAELVREVGPKEQDAVERAVTDLTGVGLLRREGDSVLPTRAALHYSLLEAVAQ
jgi:hypothetical protein